MDARTKRIALAISAAVLAIAALVRGWFDAHGIDIGLWGIDVGGRGIRWDDVPGAQEDLYLAGYVGVAAALIGAGLTAAIALGKSTAVNQARVVLAVAIAAMVYFVVRGAALDGLSGAQLSWGAFVGPASAIAAHQLLRR